MVDRALTIGNPLALLECDVSYPSWEHETADRKAFYVRGFTFFRDQVLSNWLNVCDCPSFIPDMKAELGKRAGWLATNFAWDQPYGRRHFINCASVRNPETVKFHKAAETVLLCEVIALAHHKKYKTPHPDELLEVMRIEPAVSFVHDLDREVLKVVTPDQWRQLRTWTGQPGNAVFYDMADGKTVTDKLAQRTKRYFDSQMPGVPLGDVDYTYSVQRSYKPSTHERIDVKDSDIVPAARAAAPEQPDPLMGTT